MIGKVVEGANSGGVIRYLYSKGGTNEHVNPRVVAGGPLAQRGGNEH